MQVRPAADGDVPQLLVLNQQLGYALTEAQTAAKLRRVQDIRLPLSWARQHGLDSMVLRTNINREGARAFYHALGFESFKTQYAMRKQLD